MNKFEIALHVNHWGNEAEAKSGEKRIRIASRQTENAFKIYIAKLENELNKKEIEEDELFSDISKVDFTESDISKVDFTGSLYNIAVHSHEPCTIESFPEILTLMRLKVDSIQKQLDMARKCYHEYFDMSDKNMGKRPTEHIPSENQDPQDLDEDYVNITADKISNSEKSE